MDLTSWLESEELDWRQGLALMRIHAPEQILPGWARRANQEWVDKELRLQLKEILSRVQHNPKKQPHIQRPGSTTPSAASLPQNRSSSRRFERSREEAENESATNQTNEPPEIQTIRRNAIKLHKREAMVHSQMRIHAEALDTQKAYECAHEIMSEIRPKLDYYYLLIRRWKDEGIIPQDPDVVTYVARQFKRLDSLKVQLSRAKKNDPDRVGELRQEIEDLKVQLGI